MIDQELAKNILNNLLDVIIANKGSEEEKSAVLASDYVTDKSETAPLRVFVESLTVNESKSRLNGGKYTSYSTDEEKPEIIAEGTYTVEKSSDTPTEIQKKIDNIQKVVYGTLSTNDLVYDIEKIECFLPIREVTPEVEPGEEQEIYPVGFSVDSLDEYVAPLRSTQLVGIKGLTITGPLSSKGIKRLPNFANDRRTNIISALSNFPLYRGSGAKSFYTYEVIGGASQREEIEKTVDFEYYLWEIKEEKHYFEITWTNQIKGSTNVYQKSEKFTTIYQYYELTGPYRESASFKGWYYPQSFSTLSYYPSKAYLGLFTDYNASNDAKNANGMPNKDGTNFREPPYKNGNNHTYQRMSLHRGLFSDDYVFNEVTQIPLTANGEEEQYKGYSYLDNKEIIMFPEILNADGWGNIYGFGVFENEVPTEGEKPYFWGEVKNGPVKTEINNVPLFRPNEFKVYLG